MEMPRIKWSRWEERTSSTLLARWPVKTRQLGRAKKMLGRASCTVVNTTEENGSKGGSAMRETKVSIGTNE